MKRLACRALLSGALLMVSMIGVPDSRSLQAGQSDQTVEIEVVVLPPPEGESNLPAHVERSGTVSTGLASADLLPASYAAEGYMLNFVVVDARSEGEGWIINVMQSPDASTEQALLLHHYPYIHPMSSGQADSRVERAALNHLSIGQPLDRVTLVSLAHSDAGPGVYSFRFVVAGDSMEPASEVSIVLSLAASP